jgi:hypothetical protein
MSLAPPRRAMFGFVATRTPLLPPLLPLRAVRPQCRFVQAALQSVVVLPHAVAWSVLARKPTADSELGVLPPYGSAMALNASRCVAHILRGGRAYWWPAVLCPCFGILQLSPRPQPLPLFAWLWGLYYLLTAVCNEPSWRAEHRSATLLLVIGYCLYLSADVYILLDFFQESSSAHSQEMLPIVANSSLSFGCACSTDI